MTVIPQQEISRTLNSSKICLKMHNVYFGERTFTFGEITFTFGERTFTFEDNRGFRVLGFFCFCWGVLGLRGSGGRVGVFESYSNLCAFFFPELSSRMLPTFWGGARVHFWSAHWPQ